MQIIETQTRTPMPLKVEVFAQPAVEPVTYGDCAAWQRLPQTQTQDRTTVETLITVGRQYVEARTRYTLINTTFDLWLDDFPAEILLPARPVQSVTFVKYTDGTGAVQTLSTNNYYVDTKGPRPRIIPPLGTIFPIPKLQYPNAVQVRFVAGFGAAATNVPQSYRQLIMKWVATNYENREAVVMGKAPAEVPHTFGYLLHLNALPEV